ncbi:MAG TPA: DUF6263 family protein [Chryseosolibacter sp.]
MKAAIVALIIVVCTGFSPAEKPVSLQYKFKTGEEFEYVQASKQNAVQILPGMGEMKMDGMLAGTMLLKIKSVDGNGSARIETQYSKLKMVTNSFILSMSMDSEGSQEEDGNKIIKSLTGKTFFFTLTKTGQVENVEGVENLYSGLGSLGLDEDVVTKTRKALQQTINDKSIKTLLENGLVAYPDKAVKAGDSWNTSSVQAVNFPMKIENTWSLKDADGTNANIVCEGNLTTIDKDKVNNLVNGMKSKSDLNGTQKTNSQVDLRTGWPTDVKILSDIKGKMTLLAGGLIPQDMEIPMTVKIETSYSIVKKK